MRRNRLILAVLVALGLAPGTFVRTAPPPPDYSSPVRLARLAVQPVRSGPFTLTGAWHLSSRNDHFGGYSALVARPDGTLLAASDAGRLMILPRPDMPEAHPPKLGEFADYAMVDKYEADIESLALDPATGALWLGLEGTNAIERFGPDFTRQARIRPPAMKDWGANSGPETLARLADGRFMAIEERATGERAARHNGLLFPGDPTDGKPPMPFVFVGIDGYRVVDATALPDGRALVLFRRTPFSLPPRFASAIALVDPRQARRGAELRAVPLAFLDGVMPEDNYEGITMTVERDGTHHIWLISDDNFARFQRTLLLRLRWDGAAVAHDKRRAGIPARP